jgi:hypothetical protein
MARVPSGERETTRGASSGAAKHASAVPAIAPATRKRLDETRIGGIRCNRHPSAILPGIRIVRLPIATAVFVLALASPCAAKNHLWRFTEFFSNADGSVQFIEMQECCGSDVETQMSSTSITSNGNIFNFPNNLVGPTAHRWILVATQSFADLPGAPTPDYIIPEHFFDPQGDTLRYRGTTDLVDLLAGALPRDGQHSFDRSLQTGQLSVIVNDPINFAGATGSVRAAIAPGNLDDFQNGTLQNWAGNSALTNIATGGPDGAGDRYLRLNTATSSLLSTFNESQWAGNYVTAGIDQIDVDLNNDAGSDPVSMRIMLLTPGCEGVTLTCTAWTSTNATALAPGSGWVHSSFSIAEADLTRVLGGDSYAVSLQNVERLLIRHDAGTPSPPGSESFVVATLGVDNVLPEPSGPIGLVAGAALLGAAQRRRQSSRGQCSSGSDALSGRARSAGSIPRGRPCRFTDADC